MSAKAPEFSFPILQTPKQINSGFVKLRLTKETRSLRVVLFCAHQLASADANGLSDPYAILRLGSEKFKSSIVYESTEPHWNEEFHFKSLSKDQGPLVIDFWDRDSLKDDFLGTVLVPLESLPEEKSIDRKYYLESNLSKDRLQAFAQKPPIGTLTGTILHCV